MNNKYRYDIFLSYNSKDKMRVRQVAECLRAAGLKVWFDEWVIRAGDDIYLQIERGLEEFHALVLCMSSNAFDSDWVTLERNTIIFRNPSNVDRRFIPILLEECVIPDSIRRLKYIDFREERDTAFKELLKELRVYEKSLSPPSIPRNKEKMAADNAQGSIDTYKLETKKKEIENPFIYFEAVKGADFLNRGEIINKISKITFKRKQQGNVWIVGDRKVGKTSLLHKIERIYQDSPPKIKLYGTNEQFKVKFLYCSCRIIRDENSFYQNLIQCIANRFDFKIEKKEKPYDNFINWLKCIYEKKYYIIFLLDDFDTFIERFSDRAIDDTSHFLDGFNALKQNVPTLKNGAKVFGVVCAGNHTSDELTENMVLSGSGLTYFQEVELFHFTYEQVSTLANEYLGGNLIQFSEKEIKFCFKMAHGHPFFTQNLFSIMYEEKRKNQNLSGKYFFIAVKNEYAKEFKRIIEAWQKKKKLTHRTVQILQKIIEDMKDDIKDISFKVIKYEGEEGGFPFAPDNSKRVLADGSTETTFEAIYILTMDIIGSTDCNLTNKFKEVINSRIQNFESPNLFFEVTGNDAFIVCSEDVTVLWDIANSLRIEGERFRKSPGRIDGTRKALSFGKVIIKEYVGGSIEIKDFETPHIIPRAFSLLDGIDYFCTKNPDLRNSSIIIDRLQEEQFKQLKNLEYNPDNLVNFKAKHFEGKCYVFDMREKRRRCVNL